VTAVDVYLPANPGQRTLWYPYKGGQTQQGKPGVFKALWSKMKGAAQPAGAALTGGAEVRAEAAIDVRTRPPAACLRLVSPRAASAACAVPDSRRPGPK